MFYKFTKQIAPFSKNTLGFKNTVSYHSSKTDFCLSCYIIATLIKSEAIYCFQFLNTKPS